MKASFKFIIAALAAAVALTACTKEITPNFENDKVNPAAEGSRVIAVAFAPQTKTTLEEGLQPRFANGDSILLFTVPEDENETLLTDIRKVKVDGSGNATISTNLTGTLKAFYPASAAVVKNNIVIGEISAVQTGKFADANIAGADIDENNSAQFENVAPLLIITPPSGTKKLIVRSLRTIGGNGQRSGNAKPINTSAEEKEQCTVTVLNPDSDGNYYVAFYYDYDVKLSDLSFEALFDASGTTGSIKGIPASKIAQQAAATGIENYEIIKPGIAYTIDANNWHEYVEVGGHKWATMNMGAANENKIGRLYMWGDVIGNELVPNFEENWSDDNDYLDCPLVGVGEGDSLPYEAPEIGNPSVLPLQYDAAYANWGGAWRMPTNQEFEELIKVETQEWKQEFKPIWEKGYYFTENGRTVFFPSSGNWFEAGWTRIIGLYNFGSYWSSSLNKEDNTKVDCLMFVNTVERYGGIDGSTIEPFERVKIKTIRAIIDNAASAPDKPEDPEEESPATEMEEEVLF